MNSYWSKTGSPRSGLTLVELLVVLVILAVLTTVAVQSTSGLLDQGRYDATLRTLQNTQDSIIGPAAQREPDGTALVTGFVADIGRLPNLVGADPLTQLQELWSNPANLANFSMAQAPSDSQVVVPCGWRGPYLQLAIGATGLRDGWGNPFVFLQSDGATAAPAGTPVSWIRSLGADYALGGVSYNADIDVPLVSTKAGTALNRFQATVTGTVYALDSTGNRINPLPGSGSVTIRFFGPNPATGGVLEATPVTVTPVAGTPVTYTFSTTIGPRVVRAYQGTLKSPVTRLTVQPGGQTKDLVIQ